MSQEPPAAPVAVVAARRAERAALSDSPGSGHRALLPRGLAHAVILGAVATACGVETTDLNLFPGLAFVAAAFLTRCEDCLDRLAGREPT